MVEIGKFRAIGLEDLGEFALPTAVTKAGWGPMSKTSSGKVWSK
jgi:hypothetical protein